MAAAMVAIYRALKFAGFVSQIFLWRLSRGGMWRVYRGFPLSTAGREIGIRLTRQSGGLFNHD